MAIEQPRYDVLVSQPPFELRYYPPLIVAETSVEAGARARSYIFGKNTSRVKVPMTAPVTVETSQKIAMTAPVTVENDQGQLIMRFMMPQSYSLETLPLPMDPAIKLRRLGDQKVAAVTFSGLWTEEKAKRKANDLRSWMSSRNLRAQADERMAFYNSPFTLPWLRRNEVWVPVD